MLRYSSPKRWLSIPLPINNSNWQTPDTTRYCLIPSRGQLKVMTDILAINCWQLEVGRRAREACLRPPTAKANKVPCRQVAHGAPARHSQQNEHWLLSAFGMRMKRRASGHDGSGMNASLCDSLDYQLWLVVWWTTMAITGSSRLVVTG